MKTVKRAHEVAHISARSAGSDTGAVYGEEKKEVFNVAGA